MDPESVHPRALVSLGSEDLLTETLVSPDDSPLPTERDYTDDLEDLVRMQVTQQLHSRRSHHHLDPSIPFPGPAHPPEPTSPTSLSHRSLIPRLGPSSSSSRSPSPEVPRAAGMKERTGSMSSSASLSRIPTSTNMLRGHSNTSATSVPSDDQDENRNTTTMAGARAGQWETLQVGAPPRPRESELIDSSSTRLHSAASAAGKHDPTRKRVQSNLVAGTSTKSPRAAAAVADPSTPHRSTTPTTTTTTSRKPYSNRTNLTPSRAGPPLTTTTKKPRTKPSPSGGARRKSVSTPREYSSYDLSSLPPEAFSPSPPPPLAPEGRLVNRPSGRAPAADGDNDELELDELSGSLVVAPDVSIASPFPLVYKNSKGQLTDRGREEDRIVPTVARRLEAQRLRRLMVDQGLDDDEDGGGANRGVLLLDEWGVDGTPRSLRTVRERTTGPESARDENERERSVVVVVGRDDADRSRDRTLSQLREDGPGAIPEDAGPDSIRDGLDFKEVACPNVRTNPAMASPPATGARPMVTANKVESHAAVRQEEKDAASKAGCCSCTIS